MKPTILLVEDNLDHYEHVKNLLGRITDTDRASHGIEEFCYIPKEGPATTAAQAILLLEEAARKKTPFDIFILDLEIPENDHDVRPSEYTGLDLLERARDMGAAREIIIHTIHKRTDTVLQALRGGAIDFVEKHSEDSKALLPRVLGCWQRILAKNSANLLEERVKDLIPYAETGLAHRFTTCFADLVQMVTYTTEDIEQYAHERFGLDRERDAQDYLMRCLNKQRTELKIAQENWAALKADLSPRDEQEKTDRLESLLDEIEAKLAPCLQVKKLSVRRNFAPDGETSIRDFHDDVRAILHEIIAGALSVLPDYGDRKTIAVDIRPHDGQAEVRFTDDLAQALIPGDDAQIINSGFFVGPEHGRARFGRAWGLSIAQHIALRGGGRLLVEPHYGQGNLITYFVPLT